MKDYRVIVAGTGSLGSFSSKATRPKSSTWTQPQKCSDPSRAQVRPSASMAAPAPGRCRGNSTVMPQGGRRR